MKKEHIYTLDIETFPNYFLLGLKNFESKKVKSLEISPYHDDVKEMYKMMDKIDNSDFFIVNFNGNHFDNIVLNYFYKNYENLKDLSREQICFNLWEFSQRIIHHEQEEFEDVEEFKEVRYSKDELYYQQLDLFDFVKSDKHNKYRGDNFKYYKDYRFYNWTSVDLYCFWSKLFRQSKKISLKSLACTIGWPEIQELPYHYESHLTEKQMLEVKRYNNVNDLGITDALTEILFEQIEFRESWVHLFTKKVMSMDGVAMGVDYILQTIAQKRGVDLKTIKRDKSYPKKVYIKDIIPRHCEFNHPGIIKYFNAIEKDYSYQKHKITGKIIFRNPDGSYLISELGEGGIHSKNTNQTFQASESMSYYDIDMEGMYPNLGANWKLVPTKYPEIAEILPENIKRRNEVKHTNTSLSNLLKLGNNGLVGNFKNKHSPLKDDAANLAICLHGQFLILKMTEMMIEEGINVYSQNTDGITIGVPKGKSFDHIVDFIKKQWRANFEQVEFEKLIMSNVNNYLAILKSGKVKAKGLYVLKEQKPLEDDHSLMIIPKALHNLFVHGISVDETLEKETDVRMFCLHIKCSKKFTVLYNKEVQQNINRVLPVNNGAFLYKTSPELLEPANLLKGTSVLMLNHLTNTNAKDYDINYRFVKSKIYDVLYSTKSDRMLTDKQITMF